MWVLGGCVTRMKRVWFSSEGVTQTLAALERTAQSLSVRHVRVPVTILRTGMQAYCSGDGAALVWEPFLLTGVKFSLRTSGFLFIVHNKTREEQRKKDEHDRSGWKSAHMTTQSTQV